MIRDINEGINHEVWYSVTRFATKEWGKQLYPPYSQLYQEFLDIGFYEGLSTGMPGAETFNGYYYNKTLVPYGCWFHFLVGSNIYLKLDRIIPKELMDSTWNVMNANYGCPQKKEGLFCGDKYLCTTVLSNNYDSVLHLYNIDNIEIAYCNDQCATIAFNTSCPPIELRTGYRGSSICKCNEYNDNLNCDNNKQDFINNINHQAMHLHQYQLSKESIHSYKCIINNINDFIRNSYLHSKKEFIENFEITIYFTSQLIANQNSIQKKIFNYKLLDYDKNMLLINMESSSLTYYGYVYNHFNNNSNNNDTYTENYLNQYNNEIIREKERVINFNVGSKRAPWDEPRYRYTSIHYENTLYQYNSYQDEIDTLPVYMNVVGFENPTILHIRNIAVGLIFYDMILLERNILDYTDLMFWILNEIKCLQAKKVDLIGVIGQGNNIDDFMYYRIFEYIKDYIHFNLIVNNNLTSLNHNNNHINLTVNQPIISFISSGTVQVLEISKHKDKYSFKSMLL